MATAHWRTGFTVADLVARQDAGWSFYQLVRVLLPKESGDQSQHISKSRMLDVLDNHFRFKAAHQNDFPAGEIRAIQSLDQNQRQQYQISSIGNHLCGHNGPLPDGLSNMLIDDIREQDGAISDFLDLFNNRLQSLRYLFRCQGDNNLASEPVQYSDFGRLALALTGNINGEYQHLYQQQPSTVIGMAGSLANQRLSLPAIEGLFRKVLAAPLKSIQYMLGRWLNVADEDHLKLGELNNRLGDQATLGSRVWDQQAAIGIRLGPLSNKKLRRLLPDGEDYHKLFVLLQWVTSCRCDCQVTLFSHSVVAKGVQLSSHQKNNNQLNMLSAVGAPSKATLVTYMVDLVNPKKKAD
jgi:type VI secretion system ImpH/TssG family protein